MSDMQITASTDSPYTCRSARESGFGARIRNLLPVALTLLITITIFICDWLTELGVAIGVAYVLVIWMANTIQHRHAVWIAAIVCSVLVFVGFLKSPAGGELWKVITNRTLSLTAIWLTTVFILQLRTANRRLIKLNRDLTESNDALAQSNIDLQQFAYIASHDLQTPLRHISSFVQLLQENYKDKLSSEATTWIEFTVDGVEQMQTLIRDLLTFARVESRSRPFDAVDLNDVFDSVVDVFAEENATITRDTLPVVAGDSSQLVHLLQNLVGNGIKYRSGETAQVHVSAERGDDAWLISVRDNGIGIDPKHNERIFEIFRRLHTSQEYPGTGIGLAVCRRILARHGGRIWVESSLGDGATFYFTLPLQEV